MTNQVRENDEKRQRIEVPAVDDELDLASIIAQATATAEKTFTDASARDTITQSSVAGQAVNENGTEAQQTTGPTKGFSSDPQLYMRILSLPMLESLVSSSPFCCVHGRKESDRY